MQISSLNDFFLILFYSCWLGLKLINTSNTENSVLLWNLGNMTFHHWKIECQSFFFKVLGCIEKVKAFIISSAALHSGSRGSKARLRFGWAAHARCVFSQSRSGAAAGRCGTLRATWPLKRALKRMKGLTAATGCASRTVTAERYMLQCQSPTRQHKFVALLFDYLSRPDDLKSRR